jgi:hypothetical protein
VTLTVVGAGAFLDNLPGQMSFSLKTAGTSITSQDMQVRNGGSGTLGWSLATSTSDGGNWLNPSATSGTAPSTITVGINVANLPGGGLTAGTFIGQLLVQTASSSTTVPVSVVVGANILSQVNPIDFMKVYGGANPLPQTLTIPSTGTNFNFDVTSSTATGGSWLTVSPGPGCCYSTPYSVTATVNASVTLAVGTYTAQIVVAAQSGGQSITIPVTLTVEAAGSAYFDNLPGQMSFSLVTSGTSITNQDIEIRDGGSGTLGWTLTGSTSDAGPWLTLSASSGTAPSIVSVGVSVANLPNGGLIAGTFIGELVFQSPAGRVTVPVSVTVGADILTQVNPIDFAKVYGGANPLPQTLTIASTGTSFGVKVTSSTATGGSWLSVTPGPGCCYSTPYTVTATVNASPTLAEGTYTGQIVVTTQSGSQSITIPVTLTVAPATSPFFDNVPGQMSFSFATAGNNPPSQFVQIRNAGAGTLDWTLEVTTSDGGNWLSASSASGTAPSTLSISVQKSNLPGLGLIAGTFVGELVFRTAGSSVTVPVSVTVGANVLTQVNAINFVKVYGGANPLPQILTIPSTGTNFGVDVTSSTATGGSWLSVTPGPGCCYTTPYTVTATVNASVTLAAGTYTAQIVVTTQSGSQSNTIPVTLTVAPAGGTYFDNVQGQVSFFFQTGSGNPPTQNVQIRNGGSGTLNWSVSASTSDGGSWLTTSVPSGTAPSTVSIGVVASALPGTGLIAGTFNGQLVFESAGSTVTVPVSVFVGSPIFVEAGALAFSKPFGGANPLSQNVQISSTGTSFGFSAISATGNGGSWLSVTPGPGCCYATPYTVTASIIAAATLAAGTYTGQIVLISQSGSMAMTVPVTLSVGTTTCTLSVSPTAVFLDSTSQSGPPLTVTTGPGCSWVASANAAFINFTSATSGSGNGTVTFSVPANTTGADLTGTLSVNSQPVSITQRETANIFSDVPPSNGFFDFINTMYERGITSGCATSPPQYCPNAPTTRDEMAVFIIVAIEGGSTFSYTTTPYFTDVPATDPFFKFVQKMKDLGITSGCSATMYCPSDPVTRGEMAVFIILGRYGAIDFSALSGYSAAQIFSDVPPSSPFFPFIQEMAEAGITAGCGSGMYCPNTSLTRGQMAVFIVTGLLNQLLGPTKPIIATAVPNSATPGQAVTLTLSGANTNFVQGTTQVTMAPGITPSGIVVSSATSLTVQVAVGSGVVPGPTSIVVTTGTEEAVLPNGFTVQ